MITPQHELHNSAIAGDVTGLCAALDRGADINAPFTNEPGKRQSATPLQTAAASSRPEAFELLLQRGADVNAKGEDPRSCLVLAMHAGIAGKDEMARLAVEAGADIHERAPGGQTLLHLACRCNCLETAGLLLQRGLDVHARDDSGRTPMHDATRACSLMMLRLFNAGADLDAEDDRGRRPIHEAVGHDHEDASRTLRALGASLWAVYSFRDNRDRELALSPVANAMLTREPEILLRSLELHSGYDLAQLKEEIPMLESVRFAAVHDVLRCWRAQHEAHAAMTTQFAGARP